MRRIIVLLSTIALALSGLAISPAHADTIASGSYVCTTGLLGDGNAAIPTYTINNGVVEDGINCAGAVVIPAGVTEIGAFAFYDAYSLTSITLPSGVTEIGYFAFAYATTLKSITMPSSVTRIIDYAFYSAIELTSMTIPASVTSIGYNAFSGTTALADYYFSGNAPASVDQDAFADAAAGAKVHISASATGFGTGSTWNGLVIDRAVPVPADGGYVCTTGLLGDGNDEIPTFTITDGVVTDGSSCSGAVIIPEGVTGIGNYAFLGIGGSALTSITLPESLTSIGDFAFTFTTALTSISIPKNVSSIGTAAFINSSVTSFTVDQANAKFSSVDGVLFDKNATTLISYPGGKTATSYVIPASVTNIGFGSFSYSTALTSITIPASVTGISDYAFYGASALTSITIPASVTSIGIYVFSDTTSLTDYYFSGNAPDSVFEYAFAGVAAGAKAHISVSATGFGTGPTWYGLVLARALADGNYVCATGVLRAGSDTSATYTITNGVVSNGGNCSGAVIIAPGASGIAQWAFKNSTMTSVTIPASVTSIGEAPFSTDSLKHIYFLGDAPTSLHYAAFWEMGVVTAHISATATGFGNGQTWNEMVISICSSPRVWGAKAGDGRVTVGMWAPIRTGGLAVLGYEYTLDNGASWSRVDASSTELRQVITGLTNGVRYTGMIRAVTLTGAGKSSRAFSFTPMSVPSKPVTFTAIAGPKSIALEFATPVSDGGSPITRYGYSVNGGPWKSIGTKKSAVIKNLTNGTSYSVRVVAQNAVGLGEPSESVNVTPVK